ncbi:organomercurial lyase [Salinilacihabitans rarus]|uniref:organomercurial lyase n=1 Tax=Salinilacihabitans rarus TaxID=2961596 RepID=UPI0020C84C60|nr:organomercurial lyase [Salinilacihabitans rarus]
MVDEPCDCCGIDPESGRNRGPSPGTNEGHWIDDAPITEATLPADVRAAMERFLDGGPIETLGDVVSTIRRRAGGGPLDVADLCHADGPTGHRGTVDGRTYHFECFFDAIVLAERVESPVDVRTESPGGAVVEVRATGTGDLAATPADAALSFGVAADPDSFSSGDWTFEEAYAAFCPYVRAFPDRAAYEAWAPTVPAATVGAPLSDAIPLAARFAE